MLSLKTGLHLSVGIFGAIAIAVGCAGSEVSNEGDPVVAHPGTDPANPADSGAPTKKLGAPNKDGGGSSSSSGGSAGDDDDDDDWIGGPSDGGATGTSGGTTGVDSGSSTDAGKAPETGDSCAVIDTKYTRVCGHCGKQEAICTTTRTGSLTVTDYGPCGGESGVCSAGDTQPCGNCGTQTCGSTCGWGSCKNEGTCKPGVITHDTAGCPTAGTYRSKTCEATCSFGGFSACQEPSVDVPAPGQTSSTQWEITTAIPAKRPGSCKKSTSLTPVYAFPVPLHNTGSTDVVVQIWQSAVNKASLDSVITTYTNKPSSDDDYKACLTEPQDSCSQLNDICTADGGGGFGGVDNVKVPANSTIWVYSTGWSTSNLGKFVLNVKTK